MNNGLEETGSKNGLVWSYLYAIAVLALGFFVNYTKPYSNDPVTSFDLWALILWGSCYLPVMILPIVAGWKITEFGFTLNPFLALTAILIVVMCAYITSSGMVTWQSALIEAFARMGEEIFFRGFLFVLCTELFRNKRRPWLWAAIASSIFFALAHTQTFQPGYFARYGSPDMSVGYQIAERLLNLFGLALVFTFLRVWTHSILPGAIMHAFSKAGIITLPFVLLIYGVLTFWAYWRAEPVILRVNGAGRLA